MSADEANIPDWPHKPAPPEAKRLLPGWPMLWRGLALGGAGLACLGAEGALLRKFTVVGAVALPLAVGVFGLFAWAAAIHLTGGERFDDHKWV